VLGLCSEAGPALCSVIIAQASVLVAEIGGIHVRGHQLELTHEGRRASFEFLYCTVKVNLALSVL
jgi:hypothetical protein